MQVIDLINSTKQALDLSAETAEWSFYDKWRHHYITMRDFAAEKAEIKRIKSMRRAQKQSKKGAI